MIFRFVRKCTYVLYKNALGSLLVGAMSGAGTQTCLMKMYSPVKGTWIFDVFSLVLRDRYVADFQNARWRAAESRVR